MGAEVGSKCERKRLPHTDFDAFAMPMPKASSEGFGTLGEDTWTAALVHAHDRWRQRVEELEEALKAAEASARLSASMIWLLVKRDFFMIESLYFSGRGFMGGLLL